jgi:hypothetical protein
MKSALYLIFVINQAHLWRLIKNPEQGRAIIKKSA